MGDLNGRGDLNHQSKLIIIGVSQETAQETKNSQIDAGHPVMKAIPSYPIKI